MGWWAFFQVFYGNQQFVTQTSYPSIICSTYPCVHNRSVGFFIFHAQVVIPDVTPQLTSNISFSMAAGDFLDIYRNVAESWDCVAMCFFLDTAHNVVEYIELVYNILKPGGYFINFGPLLYHFANIVHEPSIELTYEEIKDILIQQFGFVLIKETMGNRSAYIENSLSMMKMQYDSVFFVVQKPLA